jgi:hypothetical protein
MNELMIYAAVLAAGLVVLVVLAMRGGNWLAALKTRRRLKRLGVKQIRDFRCPDGIGHFFVVDYLVLRPDGISLVMYKPFSGTIYCAEQIDQWTQMLNNRSYRFPNPLIELKAQVNTLSTCVPGVDVDGYLYFDDQAAFPKGQPEQVIQSASIPKALQRNKKAHIDTALDAAWQKLCAMMKQEKRR